MAASLFDIHGVLIRFASDSSAIDAAAQELYAHFRRPDRGQAASVRVTFWDITERAAVPIHPRENAELVFSSVAGPRDQKRLALGCRLFLDNGTLVADLLESGLFAYDIARGQIDGWLVRAGEIHFKERAGMLHLAVREALKRYGIYSVHAACAVKDGVGYIFPGDSGSGKTTCCISLLRAGYGYASDDCSFLRGINGSQQILGLPGSPKVLRGAHEFFPELPVGAEPQVFYAASITTSCRPGYVLFPRITDAPRSVMEPMSKSSAFTALLPHGLVISDREIARAELETLSSLVSSVPCFRLDLGADVARLPELIGTLPRQSQAR